MVDFEALVGTKVKVEARVGSIGNDVKTNRVMINLHDVYVNGELFRDHSYIKMTKRLSDLEEGDLLSGTATLTRYMNPETLRMDKLGFESFRNVKIHSKNS